MSSKGLTKYFINEYYILNGAKYFSSGIFQNYLVFIQDKKHIEYFTGTNHIYSSKSNGMSEESIENITKSNNLLILTFVNHYILPYLNFNGHCLINNNISIPKMAINAKRLK